MGDQFTKACRIGNDSEAKSLAEKDPFIHNKLDSHGYTGLIWSLWFKQQSISRWMLSLECLDTNICFEENWTSLHHACIYETPLDIVITLTRLSTWETINKKNSDGKTALDKAVEQYHTSAALYLSWLGAECREENQNCYTSGPRGNSVRNTFTKLDLQTWIEAGCQQDAQYWAVAANDIRFVVFMKEIKYFCLCSALKLLSETTAVMLEKPKLQKLAKLFDHREVWSHVTKLQDLAWEEVIKTAPAAVNLSPAELLDRNVPPHVVKVILTTRV